jgi:hypothetical protein
VYSTKKSLCLLQVVSVTLYVCGVQSWVVELNRERCVFCGGSAQCLQQGMTMLFRSATLQSCCVREESALASPVLAGHWFDTMGRFNSTTVAGSRCSPIS